MFKRIVESVGCNVFTWLRLFVNRVFMEVGKKAHTTGTFYKITTNLKFVYSMGSRIEERPCLRMEISQVDNGRSLGIVTTSLSSVGDSRRGFDGRSFSNLYRLCKKRKL